MRSKHSSTLKQGQVSTTVTHLNPSPKQGQQGRLPRGVTERRGSAGAELSRGELSKSCPCWYKSFPRNELWWSAGRSCLVSLRVKNFRRADLLKPGGGQRREGQSQEVGGALSLCFPLEEAADRVSCGDWRGGWNSRTLTAQAEDLCSVTSTLTVAYNHLKI